MTIHFDTLKGDTVNKVYLTAIKFSSSTVLVKSFAHLNGIFFLACLEEIGPPSCRGGVTGRS